MRFRLSLARDLLALVGAGSVSYGAWLVYEPAGFIVAGLLALIVAVVGTLRGGA